MNNFDKVYFKSKAVGRLSSQNINELKSIISNIDSKRTNIEKEIYLAKNQLKKLESTLSWVNWFPLKALFKKEIETKEKSIKNISKTLIKLEKDYENHMLGLEISLPDQLETAFGTLDDRFSEILNTKKVWDITTSRSIDRVAERTKANDVIERKEVSLKREDNEKIQCDYKALYFENTNGGDLHFFLSSSLSRKMITSP